jgi:hypothetical protein
MSARPILALLGVLAICSGAAAAAPPAQLPADPVAHLVGQALTFCSWARTPFQAVVERADWRDGLDGQMHAVLVVRVTHTGGGATGAYITLRGRDERGRTFDFARAGSGVDVVDLAREYGALTPTMPVQPERPAHHLWAFVVPADVRTLTLAQDPRYACE